MPQETKNSYFPHAHVTTLSGTIESETRKYRNDVWFFFKGRWENSPVASNRLGVLSVGCSASVRPPTSQPVSLQLASYNRLRSGPADSPSLLVTTLFFNSCPCLRLFNHSLMRYQGERKNEQSQLYKKSLKRSWGNITQRNLFGRIPVVWLGLRSSSLVTCLV